jgi:EAL domain-containing protein (putative c-di-GMP-specific phosphodiesterase class I)
LESGLKNAIKLKQFQLYYQLQVDSSRRPLGAEALIRWLHPEQGLVSPAQFIPLAEETGLIIPIGKWVLETACAQLKAWQQNKLTQKLTLSVNVSARQFHEQGFVAQVKAAVLYHAINPILLKLEPTESILLENIEGTISIMNELKAIGVHFALDDFGTGFSSLQYLKKLPLNQLKIDQSFVRDLVSDNNDQAIVRTIIAMAKSLNLEVIAEGVETEKQQQILETNGCNHFQGYLFGKPIPLDEFEASLSS